MNEQRQQAYLNLVRSLLDAPNGEKLEILAAHQDLLDAGLVQTVEEVAQMCSQHGDENTANWLQNLAMQLREDLYNQLDLQPLSEEEIQAYFQFLMEVINAIEDSEGNSQVVYPLLAKNTDKLDRVLAKILHRWGINTLEVARVDETESLAAAIAIFSNIIEQFPLGDKADNIEIAITGYELALTVYTREAWPIEWAATQNNLAATYRNRIQGDRAENIEIAIAACTAALTVYTKKAMPVEWAETQNNLANAYRIRIKGDRAENIENAIAACTAALTVYTKEAMPQQWAGMQNNLAAVYSQRIKGDRAENIENAIAACTAALTVYTKKAMPVEWAATQNNLAAAYRERIKGDRAENIENAIAAFTAALTVYTKKALPIEWARTQNNLALTYSERIKGDRAENIENAIAACTTALTIYTKEALPVEWAATQNNLANAYRARIKGDRAENIEMAIAACTAALTVYTKEALPIEWARTQNNLAAAYSERIKGDRAKNIENAIAAYTAALTVLKREAMPVEWAATQNNLAATYRDRIKGDRAENIENAIAAYTAVLTVYTKQALSVDWAMTQNNFANAYIARIKGDRADNIEVAIAAYTAALTVYTKEALPVEWAMMQNNLALTYSDRIKGDRAENIEMAIAAFTAALTVRTREALPQDHAKSLWGLGIAYQDANKFNLAYITFESAITTIESLREEIISGEETKRKQAENFSNVYSRMVEVCLQLNKMTEAIEYVERSKTRNLVEQILERDSKTIFPPDVVNQLETYRDEIAVGQYQIQNGQAENPQDLAKRLQQLRQQRNKLQDKYLPVGSSFKFDKFPETLDANTAVIQWYIATDTILTFIIQSHGQQLTFWQSLPEEKEALNDWNNEYLIDYYNPKDQNKIQWQNHLETRLNKLAEILHIEEILAHIPEQCQRLIFIPHRFLHLLPLHALPVKSLYLIDLFPNGVSYAPSCQILQQVQLRQHPKSQSLLKSLFAVRNPTKDLYENYKQDLGAVNVIKKKFAQAHIIKEAKANKSAILHIDNNHHTTLNPELRQANNIFFFCHGYFSPKSPLDSGLRLADENLTLTEIIAHFKLENCRLVTLSACETGITDFTNTSDEYIGLPNGFLLAGSTNVVSSLWEVNTTATALFMIKFYEELQQQTNIVLALNAAQRWLRNTTIKGFQDWLPKSSLSLHCQKDIGNFLTEIAKNKGESTPPLESPFYWAGFYHTGKGV